MWRVLDKVLMMPQDVDPAFDPTREKHFVYFAKPTEVQWRQYITAGWLNKPGAIKVRFICKYRHCSVRPENQKQKGHHDHWTLDPPWVEMSVKALARVMCDHARSTAHDIKVPRDVAASNIGSTARGLSLSPTTAAEPSSSAAPAVARTGTKKRQIGGVDVLHAASPTSGIADGRAVTGTEGRGPAVLRALMLVPNLLDVRYSEHMLPHKDKPSPSVASAAAAAATSQVGLCASSSLSTCKGDKKRRRAKDVIMPSQAVAVAPDEELENGRDPTSCTRAHDRWTMRSGRSSSSSSSSCSFFNGSSVRSARSTCIHRPWSRTSCVPTRQRASRT